MIKMVKKLFKEISNKSKTKEILFKYYIAKFWSGLYAMSLQSNFFIFVRLILLFDIYLDMLFFSKIICRFGDISV